ncbi:uncharacterized protein LOC105438006 [Strongylocentrotus purpuratus]|uniref:Apextrin C-terminal domain-containing protein n=1 Tax=Strongylocentrotus purpuratus TaxID=7668 RepID=A0A7M7P118_STRPU|nr:uncharacterized protein LOC105438006 [Strongylocentrotus purpuratus]XP_030844469.1 uncharacterized protein LOC105438006 [Strongylocentrotus purpuratus]XP_030844470.1 uncharacterized protein LOC105438006 [Strongylocentrotus purpuratus]
MEYKFCMKTQSSSAEDTWPAGSYCIYKKGDCPSGFVSGSIRWDDENSRNGNRAGGTLPDGTYDHNTVIFFCCRSDGVTSQAISLPRGDFFYVALTLRQLSAGFATGQDTFIHWDDEDDDNENTCGGVLPDGRYHVDTRIQFCCRGDGVTSFGISLPTFNTFYLFALSSTCQEVDGMAVTPEWFRWDNENYDNVDLQSEEHPYEGIQSGGENVRLTLCFYVPQ